MSRRKSEDSQMDYIAKITTWICGNDTGISSKAIVAHMSGGKIGSAWSYPSDPADLGRCLRLLELFPEWKSRMPEMARYGSGWAGLTKAWESVSKSMADEVGIDWSKGKSAPDTYRLMELAIADGFRNDPDYDCTFSEYGTLRSAQRKQRD